MRILIVSDAWEPQVNGVVRTYQAMIPHLEELGHAVAVIGPNNFLSMPMPGYSEIRLALFTHKLNSMIEEFHPDAIHIAVEGPLGWQARRYCIKRGIQFTTCYHTQFPAYVAKRAAWMGKAGEKAFEKWGWKLVRDFHAASSAVFVATQSLEDQLHDNGFTAPMVRLVRGVDTSMFHPGTGTLFGAHKRPVYLYVGRIAVEKNIGAFLDLEVEGTKVVVGHGPELEKMKQKYPDVVFAGLQTGQALADHYRNADMFVFPSKTDTFGIVLLEAMACGLPVAAYDAIGPRDIINTPLLGAVDNDLASAVARAWQSIGTGEDGTREERANHIAAHYSQRSVAEVFANAHMELTR